MMNIDSADLELLVNQGEKSISDEINFLKDRYSIPALVGTAEYLLPDYVSSITRVTWLGYKLDPMPKRYQSEIFQDSKQYGRPYWYIYDTLGIRKISLFLFLTNHYLLSLILGAGLVLLVVLSVNFGGLVIMLTLRSLIT